MERSGIEAVGGGKGSGGVDGALEGPLGRGVWRGGREDVDGIVWRLGRGELRRR